MRRKILIQLVIFAITLIPCPALYADSAENSIKAANQEVTGWIEKINANADFYKTTICFELPKITLPTFSNDSLRNAQILKDFQNYLFGKLFTDTVDRIRNCTNSVNPDYFLKASIAAQEMYEIRLLEKTRFNKTCVNYLLTIYPPPNIPKFTSSNSENEILLQNYLALIEVNLKSTAEIVQNKYDPSCLPTEKFYLAQSKTLFEQYSQLFKSKYPNACKEIIFPPSDPGYGFVQNAYMQGGPIAADLRVGFYQRLLVSRFDNIPNEINEKCNSTITTEQKTLIYNVSLFPNTLKAGSEFELNFDFNCQSNCLKPIVEIANTPLFNEWYISDKIVSGTTKKGTWRFLLKIPEYINLSGYQPIQITLIDGNIREVYKFEILIQPKTPIVIRTDLKAENVRNGNSSVDLNFAIWLEHINKDSKQEITDLLKSNMEISFLKGVVCSSNFSPKFTLQDDFEDGKPLWRVNIKMDRFVGTCSLPVYLKLPSQYILSGSDVINFAIKGSNKSTQVQRIKCLNGNKTINVSGVNPKCPAGFVKIN